MRGLSIDVGTKNLAIYVEEFNHEEIKSIKLPEILFTNNHLPMPEYKKILSTIYKNGQCIYLDLIDITKPIAESKIVSNELTIISNNKTSGKYITTSILISLYDYLEKHKKIWDTCSFVIIEQQMNTRFKKNTTAQHIQHHIESWFIFNYKDFKPFINYPSKNKTQVLGAPKREKKKNDKSIKVWSEKLGLSILEKRRDEKTYSEISLLKKRDDVCDAIIQLQSFKIKAFIMKTLK